MTAERDIGVLHDARVGKHVLQFLTVPRGAAELRRLDSVHETGERIVGGATEIWLLLPISTKDLWIRLM